MGQLEELENFVRIAEAGGIGKAAELHQLQKSAVSRRLVELETRLGTQLIARTTRRWHLTEAGQTCYQQALKVIDAHQELAQTIHPAPESLTGTLRIAAPQAFGQEQLPALLLSFNERYPQLNLVLTLSDDFVNLMEQGIDVALRIGNPDPSLRARRLCAINLCLVASPDYLNSAGYPDSPATLAQHQLLGFTGRATQFILENQRGERFEVQGHPRFSANDGHLLNQLAIAGKGIAIAPRFISHRALADGLLEEVLPEYRLPSRELQATYAAGRFTPQKVRLFIDHLHDALKHQPEWA